MCQKTRNWLPWLDMAYGAMEQDVSLKLLTLYQERDYLSVVLLPTSMRLCKENSWSLQQLPRRVRMSRSGRLPTFFVASKTIERVRPPKAEVSIGGKGQLCRVMEVHEASHAITRLSGVSRRDDNQAFKLILIVAMTMTMVQEDEGGIAILQAGSRASPSCNEGFSRGSENAEPSGIYSTSLLLSRSRAESTYLDTYLEDDGWSLSAPPSYGAVDSSSPATERASFFEAVLNFCKICVQFLIGCFYYWRDPWEPGFILPMFLSEYE